MKASLREEYLGWGGRRQSGPGARQPDRIIPASIWLERGSSRCLRGILVTSWLPAPRIPRLECGLGLRFCNPPSPKPDTPPSIPHSHPTWGEEAVGNQEPH